MGRRRPEKKTGCDTCPLSGEIRVPGEGPEKAPLVFVGEAPGVVELRVRRPFVGPSGKLLETVFQQTGIVREEVYITNAVLCMSLQPTTPAARAVACCRERLLDEVRSRMPKVVVALGKVAAKALLGSCGSLKEERGKVVYSEELGAYVVVTYHPAHILRSPRLHRDLHADIAKARDVARQGGVSTGVCVSYDVVSTGDELVEFLRRHDRVPEVAIDTETAGDGSLLCIGLSVEEGRAVVVLPSALRGREDVFSEWLRRRTCIGHNLKHDIKVLRAHGVRGASTGGDTLLQSYVLSPFLGGHGLKQLVRENLGFYEDYSAPVEPYMKRNQMELCPPEVLYRYNAHDAAFTLMLYHDLERRLDDLDRKVLSELLYPASDALADMEELGVLVDRNYLLGLQDALAAELCEIRKEMQEVAGVDFNPNSPRQLLEVMYKHLRLPVPGRFSTDSKALNLLLRVTKHRFPELLLRYRERHKFYSTYVTKLLAVAGPDGRVRTTFNLHTTVTGRLSSSNPVNLQNQPRTPEARNAFIATPGYTLVECDLAQAEVRGWAWYARDENLKRAITESGVDVHTATACLMWGLKPEEVTPELRTQGKRLTFACVPMDTMALTSMGWKTYEEISVGDLVLGYDPQLKRLVWTPVEAKVKYDNAPLVRLYNNHFEAVVTPNHRWYGHKDWPVHVGHNKYVRGRVREEFIVTEDIKKDHTIYLSAPALTENRLPITAEEAALIGWLFTDGHIKRGKYVGAPAQASGRRVKFEARITPKKEQGIATLRKLLSNIPHSEYHRKGGMVGFIIKTDYIRDLWARARLDEISLEQFVLLLGCEERRAFFDAVLLAEGYVDAKGYKVITQKVGPVLDAIRLAAFLEGYYPTERRKCTMELSRSVCYAVRCCKPYVTGQQLKLEPAGEGPVWCIKTKLGTWVMRQGNHIVLTGNTIYQMDATTLAAELGVTVSYARELQERFFRAYPRGREWIREQQRLVRETGVFVTPFGRKLRFVNNPNDPSEIDRTAVNYPIQSLCSDITLSALVRLHRRIRNGELGDTRLLVTVHDSILLETAEDAVEVARRVKEEMELDVLDGWMPFEAEAKVGKRWGEMEEIAG